MRGPQRENLSRRRFGRLVVQEFHEIRAKQAYWWCACDCNPEEWISVKGAKLKSKSHPQMSCGCYRADPAVRQAARLEVSPARRKAISEMGGQAIKKKMEMKTNARKDS